MKGTDTNFVEFKEPDYQKFIESIPTDYKWKFGFHKSDSSDLISIMAENNYITFELTDVECLISNGRDGHMSIHTKHGMISIYVRTGMTLTQLFKPIN